MLHHRDRDSGTDRRWRARTALLLVTGMLLGSREAPAQAPDSLVLPDSTYLALTLELPVHATFQVFRLDERDRTINGMSAGSQYSYQLDRVEVVGCRLLLFQQQGSAADLGPPSYSSRLEVPLKEIDLGSLDARPSIGIWTDPPTWEVHARSINRKERPFVRSHPRENATRSFNTFTIPISDRNQAHRFKALLADAARRCESWNTTPIHPRFGNP